MATPLERAKELAALLRSHGNPADGCISCLERAIAYAIKEEREACAQVADGKASEHVDLARQFTRGKNYAAAQMHERYARVCNGSDGIADRIRARGIR